MRIVIDLQACQTPGSRTRGIGRVSMALAQAMVRNSDHEYWLALNGRFVDAALSIRAEFDGILAPDRIRLFDVPAGVSADFAANDWRRQSAELGYETFLQSLKPDFVHLGSIVEGWENDAVTSIGRIGRDHLVSAIFHDAIPLLNPDLYLQNENVRRWYFRKLMAVRQSDLLFTMSDYSRGEAIDHVGMAEDAVVTAPPAADAIFQPLALTEREKQDIRQAYGLTGGFAMYTGGIDFRKNIEGLIEAYAALPMALRRTHQLAIVCSINDVDRQRLSALAVTMGLGPAELVLTGFVPEQHLVTLYTMCDLFVFPSLHEGFGMPALEAMSCGAPTIGSDNSAIREVIGMPDALFDARNTTAMSRKIAQALTDATFSRRLRQHALVQAGRHSAEAGARIALEAMERMFAARSAVLRTSVPVTRQRPRLAFVSPLPPLETGIATYVAELLPELARHYEIEVIAQQEATSDPWLASGFPIRSPRWFARHAGRYERILYQFGNSSFHGWMFELLARMPGTVVLHDAYLGQVQHWREHHQNLPDHLVRTLVRAHGPAALVHYAEEGREEAIWAWSAAAEVVRTAKGIIVHSDYAAGVLSRDYGIAGEREVRRVAHPRPVPPLDRAASRRALALSEDAKLLCSFGGIALAKANLETLDAFLHSRLANDPQWQLVFVGTDHGEYSQELKARVTASGLKERIRITGFVSPATYCDYLAAADGAVQLRCRSRGETSLAVIDCLAFGLPVIINGHGTLAEVDSDLVIKLPAEIDRAALSGAMDMLDTDMAACRARAAQAREVVRVENAPATVARSYRDAIERFAADSRQAREDDLLQRVRNLTALVPPDEDDLIAFAATTAANLPKPDLPRLLVDISVLVQVDAKSGVQRVVKAIVDVLLRNSPAGYRVELVYAHAVDEWRLLRHARSFAAASLGLQGDFEDEAVDARNGDVFLGLDLAPDPITHFANHGMLAALRARGVAIYFIIYDLLPLLQPALFEEITYPAFRDWLRIVAQFADGAICISGAVAAELVEWLNAEDINRQTPLRIAQFPLGSDLPNAIATIGLPDDAAKLFSAMGQRPSLLMVGTLEPRKGHVQMLDAMEMLWTRGIDANLVIVGRRGWMTEPLGQRIEEHAEYGHRLWWEEQASDEYLDRIYTASRALLAASLGEGFGMPLVEAARRGCSVIARDIPVFREVMGSSAFYFKGNSSSEVADVIAAWLARQEGAPAASKAPRAITSWQDSGKALLSLILGPAAAWPISWPARFQVPAPAPAASTADRKQRKAARREKA